MSIITSLNIDWDGGFVEALGEVIIEAAFRKPAISEFHSVHNGIKAKDRVGTLGRLNKLLITDAGCGTGQTTKAVPSSQKIWDPAKLKMWMQQCEEDLEGTFFIWATKNGIDRKDLTGTDFMTFLMSILPDGVLEDLFRIAWMGDTAIVAGDLTNGAGDVPNYDQLDGIWKKLLAITTADAARRYTIAENALTPAATQLALGATAAYDVFKGLVNDSDSRLKNAPNTVIIATRTLMQNYADYLESKDNFKSFERIESGFNQLMFRGIPVIEFELLDRYIAADFIPGVDLDTPHRAVLTTRDNLGLGSDDIQKWDDFDIFFDKTTELLNIKGGFKLDTQVIEDYMVQVAH